MDPYLDTLVCMKIKLTYYFIKSKKYPHWYQCLQPLKKRQIPFYHLLQKASLEVGKFHFHSECEREREDWNNHLINFFENHKLLFISSNKSIIP